MYAQKEATMKVKQGDNWIFKFTFKTRAARSYKTVPINLASRFIVMNIQNTTGGTIASSTTDCSNSAISNALSGIAILEYNLSSTSGISAGLYNYNIYIADFPYISSATYVKNALTGPFVVLP